MDMSLGKLRELVTEKESCRAAVHGVEKSWTRLSDWTELTDKILSQDIQHYSFYFFFLDKLLLKKYVFFLSR